MKELFFEKATYHKGVNVTVRRGLKWTQLVRPGDEVYLSETGGAIRNSARIVGVVITPFNKLSRHTIKLEHDEMCHTYNGLLREMQTVYDGFQPDEEVTYLMFIPKDTL